MKILFRVLPYIKPIKSFYTNSVVGLAEGLQDLNITFWGNCNFWFDNDTNEYLIKQSQDDYKPDVEIHSISYFQKYKNNIEFGKGILYVLIDENDGNDDFVSDSEYLKYNYILKCHYNAIKKHPRKIKPWMFGLTKRIINANSEFEYIEPTRKIFINHRLGHGLRELMAPKVEECLSKTFEIDKSFTDLLHEEHTYEFPHYWAQSGRRHNREYFQKLNESILTFCFGGNFECMWLPSKASSFLSLYFRVPLLRKLVKKNIYISQFDSFRFWETFSSNSIPIHLDLEYWGIQLPIMPIPGKHYVGVKDLNFRHTADLLNRSSDEDLKKIALQGKEWVLENYKPVIQANYFLNIIK